MPSFPSSFPCSFFLFVQASLFPPLTSFPLPFFLDIPLSVLDFFRYKLLAGEMEHVMPGSVGFVDVRDVARAHVAAAETEFAAGQRYLCSAETHTWLHVAKILRELFPEMAGQIPDACADGSTEQPCMLLKNDKIRAELGLEFVPLRETLLAQGNAFIEAGLFRTTAASKKSA